MRPQRSSLSLLAFLAFRSFSTLNGVSGSSNFRNAPSVPTIDLASTDENQLARDISLACSTLGFFHVTSHGIPDELLARFREQCALYFDQSEEQKNVWKRNSVNSRGYFDDELTKQKRDWKECLDVGVPGSRDWNLDDHDNWNACLDGFNQFPTKEQLPHFRDTVVEYFDACAKLSDKISRLMARGMGVPEDDPFIIDLKERHSSYLRMNHYPPCQDKSNPEHDPLGISPHKDAGFLTILLQDDDCHSLQALIDGEWVLATPTPGALTINTGDMAQIWSNGVYKAPLHRVLTHPDRNRYSAPFFYNPGYRTLVRPIQNQGQTVKYHDVLWGYFRAVRFAGDLTDLGVEIQVEDFEKENNTPSAHLSRQKIFHQANSCDVPFDVDGYRELLRLHPD